VAVRALSADVVEAEMSMESPPALVFEAGQWVSVPFGPKNVRAYSIASTPRSAGRLTLCADVSPGGIGSAWFRGLTTGQVVEFKAPFGGFVFRRDDPRRPLFVAEEIGVVPVRSMLADLDETGHPPSGALVAWARAASRLPYHDELLALAGRRAGFAYHPVVPSTTLADLVSVVTSLAGDPRDLVAYVSGGGAMIDAVRAGLMAGGLDRKSVRWEKFW
jgi:ferredoxin-NADP reductase